MPKRTEKTGDEPVTLAEAKAHCYVTSTRFDDMIERLITAAREYAENECWRCFVDSTYEYYLDRFTGEIQIPMAPVIEVSEVAYTDKGGSDQTVPSDDYEVSNGEYKVLRPATSWPDAKSVTITYTAGYGADGAPKSVCQAILLMVSHLFNNRDAVVMNEGRSVDVQTVPMAVDALLGQHSARTFI